MPAVPYSRSRSRSRSGSRERARAAKRYRRSSGSRSRSRSSSHEDRRRRGRDRTRSRSRSPSPRTRDERSGDRRGGVAKTDAKRKEAKPSSGGSRNTAVSSGSVTSDARKPKPASTAVRTNENSKKKKPAEDEGADGDTADEEAAAMQALLGFGKFGSTKNRHVQGNNIYVANIVKKRRYRQYMNRRGGFNRPLDAIS